MISVTAQDFLKNFFFSVVGGSKKRRGAAEPIFSFREPEPTDFKVILLAVHEKNDSRNTLHAIVAPTLKKAALRSEWGFDGQISQRHVKYKQQIFFCVPLRQEEKHVSLEDCNVW